MTVRELINILNKIDDKSKMVLDNNSAEIINVHISTEVIYLEQYIEEITMRNNNDN